MAPPRGPQLRWYLGVGPAPGLEVYCSAVTSSLCDIFLGVDIQRGIRRRVRGCHILYDT